MASVGRAALVACSDGMPAAQPSATVGTGPPRTTTTDPFAVPPVIDSAYLNRVLAGLDAAVGDVVRMIVRTKTIPREGYDRLRAVYGTDSLLQLKIDSLQRELRDGLPGYRLPEPGDKVSLVREILSAGGQCAFARDRQGPDPLHLEP